MRTTWFLALRAVRSRPLRSSLTVLAVAAGVAAVLGVQLALGALDQQARDAQALRVGRSQVDVRATGAGGLDPARVTALTGIAQVVEASPLLEKRVVAKATATAVSGVTVTVVAVQDGEAAMRPVRLVAGRLPHAGAVFEVALDQGLSGLLTAARAPHPVAVGDSIELTTATGPDRFRVVGLSAGTSAGPAFTRSTVFISAAAARGPLALGLRTPLVALRLAPGADVGAAVQRIAAAEGGAATVVDPRSGGGEPLGELRGTLVLVTLLSVLVGAGACANTVALGALERRREIGLLRAAGASGRQVARLFMTEALVLAAGGAALGVAAGAVLGGVLVTHFAASDLPTPALPLAADRILEAVATGAGAAVLAATIPAVAAGRLRPLAALRPNGALQRERPQRRVALLAVPTLLLAAILLATASVGAVAAGVVLAAVGAGMLLPLALPRPLAWLASALSGGGGQAAVAAANLARRRNRTGLTVAGLVVSIATAVSMSALAAGMIDAGDRWVGRLFIGDTVLQSAATQPDELAASIARTTGVTAVSPLRFFAAPVQGQATGLVAVDPAGYASSNALDVVEGSRDQALVAMASGPAVLVPEQAAHASGWHPGDEVSMATQNGITAFRVAAVVAHSFPGGDGRETLMVGRTVAQHYFGRVAGGFDDLQVATSGGGASPALDAAATRYGLQVLSVDRIRQAARAGLSHAVSALDALAWLAVTVAMVAVVITLVVNARLGTRELALLRAVGLSRSQAVRLGLWEAALLAACGVVLGTALGLLLAVPLLRATAVPGFVPSFSPPLLAMLAGAAAVVMGTLAAALPPARRAASAGVVAAIRYE